LSGVCSRRKAEALIRNGEIAVNGEVVSTLGTCVSPENDTVTYKGKRLHQEKKIYIIMNKPKGYVASVKDTHNEKTVLTLVHARDKRIYPAGRLDKGSRGLLVLTNDGEFAYILTHPKFGVEKHYEVTLDREFDPTHKETLVAKGLYVEGKRTRFHALEVLVQQRNASRVKVVLYEGRKRQIRVMFYKLGYKVRDLVRTEIGPLKLAHLKEGAWKELDQDFVNSIKRKYNAPR